MNDDGHSPETCNYQECKAGVETPCPFVKDQKPEPPLTVDKQDYRLLQAADELALAAARVTVEYDGIHRLRAALAVWFDMRSRTDQPDNSKTKPDHKKFNMS